MVFFFFERIDYVDRPAPILSLSLFGGTNARAPKVSPLCLLLLLLGISPRVVVRFDSSSLSRAGALRRENSKARSVDIFLRRKMIPLEYLGFKKPEKRLERWGGGARTFTSDGAA